MPLLKNQRHELFAHAIVKGLTGRNAYLSAGYEVGPEIADVSASRLMRTVQVAARIKELRDAVTEKAMEETGITKARVLNELAKIGFANMLDYVSIGTDGDPFIDFSALTREQAAAIGEVTVEDFKDGRGEESRDVRRVKFKMLDKKGALVDIGKELGMFVERKEIGVPGDFANLSENELERELKSLTAGKAHPGRKDRAGIESAEEPQIMH